ncbi:MAG: hypothetical protein C4521_12480 [Actinobacteria bacterium]|nr:MAG: hypothetical protein C4521_12480 [Actinomycetota bacterium]
MFSSRWTRTCVSAALIVLVGLPVQLAWAGGYSTPTAGQNPHGGYSDSTSKCKVCHAVHNANASVETSFSPPQALLRTRRGVPRPTTDRFYNGMACAYCHIVDNWSLKRVYGGDLYNYQRNSRYNHDDNHRYFGGTRKNYAGCMSCHSVHGSNLLPGYEVDIVSANPNPDWNDLTVDTLTNFCRDCHEDTSTAFGTWGYRCGQCHLMVGDPGGNDETDDTDQMPPFYTQDRDRTTHVMTSTLTNPDGMQVAWSDTTDCRDCHMGGDHTESNSFPHYTSGAYFLDDEYRPPDSFNATDTDMDRVCLNCHAEGGDGGAYTTGVGRTF